MRRTPSGARARSFTSCRLVVAMCPFGSGGEQPLVFALLPFERLELAGGQPRLDGGAERRLAAQSGCKGHIRELEGETAAELRERPELVQLADAVEAGARAPSARRHPAPAGAGAEDPG